MPCPYVTLRFLYGHGTAVPSCGFVTSADQIGIIPKLQGTLRSFIFLIQASEFAQCQGDVKDSRSNIWNVEETKCLSKS